MIINEVNDQPTCSEHPAAQAYALADQIGSSCGMVLWICCSTVQQIPTVQFGSFATVFRFETCGTG